MIVKSATRVESLADDVAQWLADVRDDPFNEDVLLTPSGGISRWLTQRLALSLGAEKSDGVCARVTLTDLHRFLRELGRPGSACGEKVGTWSSEALFPVLLQCLDDLPDTENLKPVTAYLRVPNRPRRRVDFAQRIANRFAWHATWNRPMLRDWEVGNLVATGGESLDAMDRWQPELWTLVSERVGMPWESDPEPPAPDRVAQLGKVGAFLLPEVADHEWAALGELDQALTAIGREIVLYELEEQPCHELQRMVGTKPPPRLVSRVGSSCLVGVSETLGESLLLESPDPRPTTLLERLQTSLVEPDLNRSPLDDSVQIHLSHGPDRQVEVLRDIILTLLEDDPTLEPRDILVMTDNLEQYGPLVEAAFADGPGSQARVIPSIRRAQTHVAMEFLLRALESATGSASAESLYELLQSPLVVEGFGLTSDDSFTLRRLIEDSGIRWGITEESRGAYGVDSVTNTWESGLNRMILGLALSPDDLPIHDGMTPMDISSDDAARLVRAFAGVTSALSPLTRCDTARGEEWAQILVAILEALCPVASYEAANAVQESLAFLTEALAGVGFVSIVEVEAILRHRWRGRIGRSNLLRGDLTVTNMRALEYVPHRVIIHLGLDQATFPRRRREPGDCVETLLNLRAPDATTIDRFSFLHSIMSARQRLIVLCVGFDPTTNEPVTLPTPVLELVEAIETISDEKLSLGQGKPPSLVFTHPAQPFSVSDEPRYSFDASVVKAAYRLQESVVARQEAVPELARDNRDWHPPRLNLHIPATIDLNDICSLFVNPAAHWLRGVGITPSALTPDRAIPSDLPIELDSLEQWKMKDRLLATLGEGLDPTQVRARELARQLAPPEPMGSALVETALTTVSRSRARVADLLEESVDVVGVRIAWDGLPEIHGSVPVRGDAVVSLRAGNVKGKQIIRSWIVLLALACSQPQQTWRAVTAGDRGVHILISPEPEQAQRLLKHLVDLYLSGRQSPLPLPADFSEAQARASGPTPNLAALSEDLSASFDWGEEWAVVWESADNLLSLLPEPGDAQKGDQPRATRFLTLVESVYGPLQEARRSR